MKQKSTSLHTLLLSLVMLVVSFSVADKLTGSWSFKVEQTAPEYSSGTLTFEETKNSALTGNIIFNTGRKIALQAVSVVADTVTFKALVDGNLVTTVCILNGDKLSGSVITADGNLSFFAERKK